MPLVASLEAPLDASVRVGQDLPLKTNSKNFYHSETVISGRRVDYSGEGIPNKSIDMPRLTSDGDLVVIHLDRAGESAAAWACSPWSALSSWAAPSPW